RRQLPGALPAQRRLREAGQAAGLRRGAPLRRPGERVRCRPPARRGAVLSLPVPGAAAARGGAQLFRGRRAGRAAGRGRDAAGHRGDQAGAGHRRAAARAAAAVRRAGDALPRDPAGRGPGVSGLRRWPRFPWLCRLRGVLRRRRSLMTIHGEWKRLLAVACLWLVGGSALAADPCPSLARRQADPQVATRVAAVACDEHLRWNRPFIDADGRLASAAAYEAEDRGLQDGGGPWRRVAFYWQSSGLLSPMGFKPGASDCAYAAGNPAYPGLGCRGFVVDSPWSAAFISWVMQRAGVPGFKSSASHFDYVRAARIDPAGSPYRFLDPRSTPPATGDLLCYVRATRVYGFEGLAAAIDGGAGGLQMHCDVVAAAGGGRAYAIGGNVQQAVTMRMLNLNAGGL